MIHLHHTSHHFWVFLYTNFQVFWGATHSGIQLTKSQLICPESSQIFYYVFTTLNYHVTRLRGNHVGDTTALNMSQMAHKFSNINVKIMLTWTAHEITPHNNRRIASKNSIQVCSLWLGGNNIEGPKRKISPMASILGGLYTRDPPLHVWHALQVNEGRFCIKHGKSFLWMGYIWHVSLCQLLPLGSQKVIGGERRRRAVLAEPF